MGPAKTSTTRHVLRQRAPLALGVVSAVVGVLLLVSLARDWADNPQPLFLAWLLLGLASVWSVFVRPAVLLDDGGVTIRNVVREIRIPWAELTDVESRWNLKVLAGDRGYTAWAISSKAERPKGVPGGLSGRFSPGRLDRDRRGDPSLSTSSPKVTASMVARLIRAAWQDYDEAVAQGSPPATPDAGVRITWSPLVVAVLLLPAIAVVALSLA